jgi:hypothetical protein
MSSYQVKQVPEDSIVCLKDGRLAVLCGTWSPNPWAMTRKPEGDGFNVVELKPTDVVEVKLTPYEAAIRYVQEHS